MTAYLQLLQPDLIGCHVIFNPDTMEGQVCELGAFEGGKRGTVAHMQTVHRRSIRLHALCWNKSSLFIFVYLPVCFLHLVENEFMSRRKPPSREPQMLPPVAPRDLATLEHFYSGIPVRAAPKCRTPSPQSIHGALLQSLQLLVCSTFLSFNLSTDFSTLP